jgi:hypothetical protein
MLPLGSGNDRLVVGDTYVISIYGTKNMFSPHINTYRTTHTHTQLWKCVRDDSKRFSFTNLETGKYLRRDAYQNLRCVASCSRESLPDGGYRLSADIDGRISSSLLASDSQEEYMIVVAESNTMIGLHQRESKVLRRFDDVMLYNTQGWCRSVPLRTRHYTCYQHERVRRSEGFPTTVSRPSTWAWLITTHPHSTSSIRRSNRLPAIP